MSSATGVVVGWAVKGVAHTLFLVVLNPDEVTGWAIAVYFVYATGVTLAALAVFVAIFRGYVAHVQRHERRTIVPPEMEADLAADMASGHHQPSHRPGSTAADDSLDPFATAFEWSPTSDPHGPQPPTDLSALVR